MSGGLICRSPVSVISYILSFCVCQRVRRSVRVGVTGCGRGGGVTCAVAWPVVAGPGAVRVTFARATAA